VAAEAVVSRRLAVALSVVGVVLIVPAAITNAVLDYVDPLDLVAGFGFMLLGVGASVTGGVVAARVPANAVGWVLIGLGVGIGFTLAFGAYAEVSSTTERGPLPGAAWAAWLGDWPAILTLFGGTTALLLLFPDGRFLSPRWRWAGVLIAAGVVFATATIALAPNGPDEYVNPAAPGGAAGELMRDLEGFGNALALPALGIAAASLMLRLKRSAGIERLQLKWFTYTAAMAGLGLGLSSTSGPVADAGFLVGLLALAGLPVAAGIAVLRYRLYDIDLVIRRTLVYGALTATLAAAYLGSVLLVGLAVGQSDVAIALSTLAVAALFRPARGRIQGVVDRRFYRRRYDAARTLESFGARLRDEIDLETLGADLRGVVRETVQPAHVSLWLRSER
jgi:hypothetical protein